MATLGEYLGAGSGTTKLLLHLNGNSTDSSGNSNNGTDTAITYSQANGKFGQGAGFNGSSSKINCGTSAGLLLNIFTWSFWVNLPNYNKYSALAETNTSAAGGALLRINGTTGILVLVKTNIVDIGQSTDAVPVGVWTNVIVTYNSTTGAYAFYINSKNAGSGTNAQTFVHHDFSIGIIYNTPVVDFFNGLLDEVIVENIAWTPQQVQKYYTFAKGRFGIV